MNSSFAGVGRSTWSTRSVGDDLTGSAWSVPQSCCVEEDYMCSMNVAGSGVADSGVCPKCYSEVEYASGSNSPGAGKGSRLSSSRNQGSGDALSGSARSRFSSLARYCPSANSAEFTLIVNVPFSTSREDLTSMFHRFGEVELAMVVCNEESRHPHREWTCTAGYAFVKFRRSLDAMRALKAATEGQIVIKGASVRADWARKDSYAKSETGKYSSNTNGSHNNMSTSTTSSTASSISRHGGGSSSLKNTGRLPLYSGPVVSSSRGGGMQLNERHSVPVGRPASGHHHNQRAFHNLLSSETTAETNGSSPSGVFTPRPSVHLMDRCGIGNNFHSADHHHHSQPARGGMSPLSPMLRMGNSSSITAFMDQNNSSSSPNSSDLECQDYRRTEVLLRELLELSLKKSMTPPQPSRNSASACLPPEQHPSNDFGTTCLTDQLVPSLSNQNLFFDNMQPRGSRSTPPEAIPDSYHSPLNDQLLYEQQMMISPPSSLQTRQLQSHRMNNNTNIHQHGGSMQYPPQLNGERRTMGGCPPSFLAPTTTSFTSSLNVTNNNTFNNDDTDYNEDLRYVHHQHHHPLKQQQQQQYPSSSSSCRYNPEYLVEDSQFSAWFTNGEDDLVPSSSKMLANNNYNDSIFNDLAPPPSLFGTSSSSSSVLLPPLPPLRPSVVAPSDNSSNDTVRSNNNNNNTLQSHNAPPPRSSPEGDVVAGGAYVNSDGLLSSDITASICLNDLLSEGVSEIRSTGGPAVCERRSCTSNFSTSADSVPESVGCAVGMIGFEACIAERLCSQF